MGRTVYDDSPALAQVALTSEELDDLLLTDGTYFTRDPRRVRHLLTRVRAAFGSHVDQMRDLQRDIEHMHAAARTRMTPVSAAREALRQLTLEEQRLVFDMRAQALIDAVETAHADADRARTAARSEANRVKFALGKVLGDPEVPAEVRGKLEAAFRLLPEDLGPEAVRETALPEGGGFTVAPRIEVEDDEQHLPDDPSFNAGDGAGDGAEPEAAPRLTDPLNDPLTDPLFGPVPNQLARDLFGDDRG